MSDGLIQRLHTIMRPFLLRRLKKDVEKVNPPTHPPTIALPNRLVLLYHSTYTRTAAQPPTHPPTHPFQQLPGKFEHVVMCPLSRRQLHLYEEFMARSSTRAALAGGNFMGMMNVLMQLRKVGGWVVGWRRMKRFECVAACLV